MTGRGADCIASAFANKSGIGQVIAPDTWIWGLKDRYYFIGYSSDPSVSTIYTYQNEADFIEFKDSIDDKMFLLYGWAMSVHDNDEFLDPEGFLLFKGNAAGISIYNNDVFFGDLHEYNSGVANNPKTVGVIVVPAHLLEDYGYVYNDPILDS